MPRAYGSQRKAGVHRFEQKEIDPGLGKAEVWFPKAMAEWIRNPTGCERR